MVPLQARARLAAVCIAWAAKSQSWVADRDQAEVGAGHAVLEGGGELAADSALVTANGSS